MLAHPAAEVELDGFPLEMTVISAVTGPVIVAGYMDADPASDSMRFWTRAR